MEARGRSAVDALASTESLPAAPPLAAPSGRQSALPDLDAPGTDDPGMRQGDLPPSSWEEEKARLTAELDEMRQENERLAALAEGRFSDVRLLRAGPDGKGGFSFDLAGGPVQFIAEYLAQMLGKDRDEGPSNYAEMEIQHHEMGGMTLTLQRRTGKTPHQFRLEAEGKARYLQARIDGIRGMLAALQLPPEDSAGVENQLVESACKGYWPMHWPKHFDPADAHSIKGHMRAALRDALSLLLAGLEE